MRELLPFLRKPSRYIGPESNAVVKRHDSVKIKVVLVYPDLYEVGLPNLGLKILYQVINELPYALAERAYLPAWDMQALLKKHCVRLASIETDTPLDRFDIIGITLQTELNYINIPNLLKLAGLNLYSKDRALPYPLIIAGGSCAFNPEPVSPFFDAIIVGDGEDVIKEIIDAFAISKDRNQSKDECLEMLADIQGVYVPALYKQVYDEKGTFKGIVPVNQSSKKIKRRIVSDINKSTIKRTIIPYIKPIHDRLIIEIARGCTKGCRFCQAGMIYRPVREKDAEVVIREIQENVQSSGYSDISLLSLSAGNYSNLMPLLKAFMQIYKDDRCSISLPSLRTNTVTMEMLEEIKKVRKSGFTVAPEAGTQRLRDIINKGITEQDILTSVEIASKLGWQTIKLYFMIGLPYETDEDIKGLGELLLKIHDIVRKQQKKTKINTSIAMFIPKPHTAFQWSGIISIDEYRRRLGLIRQLIKKTDVSIKWQAPEVSHIEAILSAGDRRLAGVIEKVSGNEEIYDGTGESINYNLWVNEISKQGFNIEEFIGERGLEEPLPWDHIDTYIPKFFLIDELIKSQKHALTPDCFQSTCYDCGVCDFRLIEPVVSKILPFKPVDHNKKILQDAVNWSTIIRIRYTKTGMLRFLSHLEFIDFLMRSIHRAGLPVAYTSGFHPKPRLSFCDPLQVGIESEAEYMDLNLYGEVKSEYVLQILKTVEYEGLRFLEVKILPYGSKPVNNMIRTIHYELLLETINSCNMSVLSTGIDLILKSDNFIITSGQKDKKKDIDVRQFIDRMFIDPSGKLVIVIKKVNNRIIGPIDILEKGLAIPYHEIINVPLKKVDVEFIDE